MSAVKENLGQSTAEVLLQPHTLNDKLSFKGRVVMAPMTRCVNDDDPVPTADMAAYYAKRANAGMIISEATIIHPCAQGYPNVPASLDAQIAGWA